MLKTNNKSQMGLIILEIKEIREKIEKINRKKIIEVF